MTAAITTGFRGEVPVLTPRSLPAEAAQVAINCKLTTGDLAPFKKFALTEALLNSGTVESIFLLDTATWLSWTQMVDVARGIIPGDTTKRTYITGLDVPRFTNLALATGGAKPWPFATRKLGVPAPDQAPTVNATQNPTPAIDVVDAGNQLTSWTTSGTTQVPGSMSSAVTQNGAIGNPAPSYQLFAANNQSAPCYMYRDFGVANCAAVELDSDVAFDGNGTVYECKWVIAADSSGGGCEVGVAFTQGAAGGPFLVIGTKASWGSEASWLEQIPLAPLVADHSVWYSMHITLTRNSDGTSTVTAVLKGGATTLGTASVTSRFTVGGYCGVTEIVGYPPPALSAYVDNIEVKGSGTFSDTSVNEATSYVVTFVNDLGEESAPSPPSATVLRPDGLAVVVTSQTALPAGYNNTDWVVTTKNIYRAVTGATGTSFLFVAAVPLATATYTDTVLDKATGDALGSSNWALPPSDLQGIMALPNGIMVGFRANQLCFSAKNHPHAWPVEYRLNTDTDIVGIGNVDNTVVIGTKSFIYTATGNDPAAYSMSKFEVPYSCSSKRSIAYLTGIGVVFAGPNGLMAVSGASIPHNLTDQKLFTRAQWQALSPSSMLGVAYNDVYYLFYDNGTTKGGYAIDPKANGWGVIELGFHASAAYADPISGALYLVLDYVNEPDDVLLPARASPPSPVDGKTIWQFEGGTGNMTYRWRGKAWFLLQQEVMQYAQVRTAPTNDYSNLVAKFYGDGTLVDSLVVTGEPVFTLADYGQRYTRFEIELIGTSSVGVAQAAEDLPELA